MRKLFPHLDESIFTPIYVLHMQIALYNAYGWLCVDNALLFYYFDGVYCGKLYWFIGEEFVMKGCDCFC
jgi:hypothetical protein